LEQVNAAEKAHASQFLRKIKFKIQKY